MALGSITRSSYCYKAKEKLFSEHFLALCLVLAPSFKKQYILIAEKIEHKKYKRESENRSYTQILERTLLTICYTAF